MYYGIFLEPVVKDILIKRYKSLIPADWTVYADHITLVHKVDKNYDVLAKMLDNFIWQKMAFNIIGFGISENAVALLVDINTQNKHSHITLAVKPGHKPVESNLIENWYMYEKTYAFCGRIDKR